MDIKAKHLRRTQAEWQRVIDEQKRSGLSQEKYCRQHGIAYSSFQGWRASLYAANVAPAGIMFSLNTSACGVCHESTRFYTSPNDTIGFNNPVPNLALGF
ncbi:MAG: hypothetical protein AABY83_11810 [Pseudomonadota bacterium]